jgi:hypothetical protein
VFKSKAQDSDIYLNYYLAFFKFKILQVFQQKNQIINLAGMIMSEKLRINQSLYVQLDSIAFSYQKFYIQNIKNVRLGKEEIIVPNLCNAIRLVNCSDVIFTSQVHIYLKLIK